MKKLCSWKDSADWPNSNSRPDVFDFEIGHQLEELELNLVEFTNKNRLTKTLDLNEIEEKLNDIRSFLFLLATGMDSGAVSELNCKASALRLICRSIGTISDKVRILFIVNLVSNLGLYI